MAIDLTPIKDGVAEWLKNAAEIYEYTTLPGNVIRQYFKDDHTPTETITYPAYARGIGQCYFTTSVGQDLVDGTFNFPQYVDAGATTIFTASNGISTVEYKTVTTATRTFSFTKSGTSYYYSPQLNASGERIRIFWNDTDAGKELNGIYALTSSYPQAYPANINQTPQYPFRLKYFTYNSFKNTTVDNSNGINVPPEYQQTWNINVNVGGDNISFEQYRTTIINNYNNYVIQQDPTAETIDPSDPPSDLDWEPMIDYTFQDPTEPSTEPGGGFVFNYNEVISPGELEDILDDHQYNIPDVTEDMYSLEVLPTMPTDVISEGVDAGINVLNEMGTDTVTSLGLAPLFIGMITISVIMFILRGR